MTQNTSGPSKLVTARPISAPNSSWRRRIDSGEPSKPDRLARTTTGRFPLAALIARAVFFDDMREQGAGGPRSRDRRPGRTRAPAHRMRLEAEERHRDAADVRVPDDRCVGRQQVLPALERLVVLIGDGPHDRPDVEGLLAVRVRSSLKTSPTVAKSDPSRGGCGERPDVAVQRVVGRRPSREALARRDVAVLVVAPAGSRRPRRGPSAQYCA